MADADADGPVLESPAESPGHDGALADVGESDDAEICPQKIAPFTTVVESSKLHGIALCASDLRDPVFEEYLGNHERSQDVLAAVFAHRGVRSPSRAPFVNPDEAFNPEDRDHCRKACTRSVLLRLRERGIHCIRSFRIMLHHMDAEGTGHVLGRTLEGALAHMGIRLKVAEFEEMMQLYGVGEDEEIIDYVALLAHGYSNWSFHRQEVVLEAFTVLRERCPGGYLGAEALEKGFDPWALTPALVPDLVEHESAAEFLTQWSDSILEADGIIRMNDFLDYYLDASLSFDTDQEFCQFVCKSWGINPDDWLAKKVFRAYAVNDGDECVGDELFLPTDCFKKMLTELDPTTTEEEFVAWHAAIDQDNSGWISLDEFLSSKVLKVKRLFDQFVTDDTRQADKHTMQLILQSLNSTISEEEAEAVYQYADQDNNGVVSFSEFLQNNLLKLLQIFDDFDRTRSRSFNEAELKKLLRRLDPYLADAELTMIYKAIDVDRGGSISFVEFCESRVLAAKALFDRFDTTRRRSLTQFKFRKLMMDMDKTLTPQQMEAIYALVVDHNEDKVHLSGFLNPNIVKLSALFNKYDSDGSRHLDVSEFKCMLKDMYKSATDKDVQAIVDMICPPGCEEGGQGVSFTTYIQRFKEISRKHDLIQLAKRREKRQKARSKGLVFQG